MAKMPKMTKAVLCVQRMFCLNLNDLYDGRQNNNDGDNVDGFVPFASKLNKPRQSHFH